MHPPRIILPLQKNGDGPPLFVFPGSGGNYLVFRDFSLSLKNKIPIFAVQPRGMDGVSKPYGSLEERITDICSNIISIQPNPPYFLLGYCYGGRIAFAVAQRLRKEGREVGMLGLLETRAPHYGAKGDNLASLRNKVKANLRAFCNVRSTTAYYILMRKLGKLWKYGCVTGALFLCRVFRILRKPVPPKHREYYVRYFDFQNGREVDYSTYEGTITLFWCDRPPKWDWMTQANRESYRLDKNIESWRQIAANVNVVHLPGDHDSILQPELAPEFAKRIYYLLRSTQNGIGAHM